MKKLLCTLFALLLFATASVAFARELPVGESVFEMQEPTGATTVPIAVYCYRAANWAPGRPIVFVFHGMNRNADDYRASWERFADEDGLLIVCPEFTDAKYPGSRYYNIGNLMDKTNGKGNLQPKDEWVFPVVDRVIRDVKERMGAASSPVAVFGHSAGAQMVHRYALFGGPTEANLIMPANAGWYTMPDENARFPYGLDGVPISDEELAAAFAKPVVILLGEADTRRTDNLRQTPEADAQGMNRLERGKKFFAVAQEKASEMGVPFNWQAATVSGVGHDGAAMADAALAVIEQMFLQ